MAKPAALVISRQVICWGTSVLNGLPEAVAELQQAQWEAARFNRCQLEAAAAARARAEQAEADQLQEIEGLRRARQAALQVAADMGERVENLVVEPIFAESVAY